MGVIASVSIVPGSGSNVTSSGIDTTGAKSIFVVVGKLGSRVTYFTDSNSNTWTACTDYGNDFEAEVTILYCRNPTVGAGHTFTGGHGFDPTAYSSFVVVAFSEELEASPLDQQNGARAASGTTLAAGSVTPSQNGELVIAAMSEQPVGATLTIDSGYSIVLQETAQSGNSFGAALAWKLQTTAAATNPTWTCSSSAGTLAASIATFKVVSGGGDTTPPVLTTPTGSATGPTTATVGATTDEGNGTLYAVVTTSATQPSVAQIKAGQTHTGSAAPWGGSVAVSSTGAKTLSSTGLTASTAYYGHLVHSDAAGNDSNRVSSATFSTPAVPGLTSNPLKNNTGTLLTNQPFEAYVSNPSTGALVLKKTGLTSHATTAVVTFTDASLTAATAYRVVWRQTSTGAEGLETLTAT